VKSVGPSTITYVNCVSITVLHAVTVYLLAQEVLKSPRYSVRVAFKDGKSERRRSSTAVCKVTKVAIYLV
jgi:hypothetical protein